MKPALYRRPVAYWAAPQTHYRVSTPEDEQYSLFTNDGKPVGTLYISQLGIRCKRRLCAVFNGKGRHYFIS